LNEESTFPAPRDTTKAFSTVVARLRSGPDA